MTSSEAHKAANRETNVEPGRTAAEPASTPVKPNARDAAGAVALLAALCAHAKAGDHSWVAARVRLPLLGNHSLNATDADPTLHPNDNASVEDFQYTDYCTMLPAPGTLLRAFERTTASASGIVDFGAVPHRVGFDLSFDPPRLNQLDAQIEPSPLPDRPAGTREYELGAPPLGFTRSEPAGSVTLRRKTIALLEADPRCVEAYVARHVSAVRFRVERTVDEGGANSISVAPFQLIAASLYGCLKTQLTNAPELAGTKATRAIVELLIPIDAAEATGLRRVDRIDTAADASPRTHDGGG